VVADAGFPGILADQYNIAPTLDGNVTLGSKKNVSSDIWNGDMNCVESLSFVEELGVDEDDSG
jgi:hypothetical protein